MKKIFFFFVIVCFISAISYSQHAIDPRIDSVVNLISTQHIQQNMRALTGDTTAMIGGIPRLIFSRFYTSPGNELAGQYIFEKFQSYGYTPSYFQVDSICKNVIAVKTGTKYPNQKYIIGGHYDNILWPINPGPLDTVHGADDNCTGTCGVLEMARLLSGMSFEYTIVFAAWDQEEVSPWGAWGYAYNAMMNGDSIRAYVNMDMLGWNELQRNNFWAGSDSCSKYFNEVFLYFSDKYNPTYNWVYKGSESYGSDQLAFLRNGYKVFNVAEYNVPYNPNYHKITDDYSNIDFPYYTSLLKPTLAFFMAFALNDIIYFGHQPLTSSSDTSSRVATVIIDYPEGISTAEYPPRVYFKANNGHYEFRTAYYQNLDTFKFLIPGFPPETLVKYYFAAQDISGNIIATNPFGGSGISPPGTIPPSRTFSYDVLSNQEYCAENCPKPIKDMQITIDSIPIYQPGIVSKVTVNVTIYHKNDGDLILQLQKFGSSTVNLSQRNGEGGSNYFYTTFDDNASVSITEGAPPFTGRYKPQSQLSAFKDLSLSGNWVLRIFDAVNGNSGTLAYWCIIFQIRTSVGIQEPIIPRKFQLSQNYPNPFNSSTRISYSIPKNTSVELKIYDLLGREVRTLVNERQSAGNYTAVFNAGNLASGIYYYILKTDNNTSVRKMVIIK